MYKSKEIRWFFKDPQFAIDKWFDNRKLNLTNTPARQDFYLAINRDDFSIKLREGNIEIKERIADRNNELVTPEEENLLGALGNFEYWIKWSFNLNDKDDLASGITKKGDPRWIKVDKLRIGVKIAVGTDRQLTFHDIKERVPYGCQIEYTKITIMGDVFYSFGLEWFGEPILDLPNALINEILGDTKLVMEESKGYAAFLNNWSKSSKPPFNQF